MSPFEAAKILYRNDSKLEAKRILQHLWDSPQRSAVEEFPIFCAFMELWIADNPSSALTFLEVLCLGEGEMQSFWDRRSMKEKACLYDWLGQVALHQDDISLALDSFSRAASLGRDCSLLWFQLGALYIQGEDLELGLRYLRRSLQIFRQIELNLSQGKEDQLGFFGQKNPLGYELKSDSYLKVLLDVTRLAKSKRNLKSLRDLVVELIHHFPDELRFRKIRLLLERSLVDSSVSESARLSSPSPRDLM
jgi:hypothetical protein